MLPPEVVAAVRPRPPQAPEPTPEIARPSAAATSQPAVRRNGAASTAPPNGERRGNGNGAAAGEPITRLFVNAGKRHGVTREALAEAFTASGIEPQRVRMHHTYGLVDVPRERADEAVAALTGSELAGRTLNVELAREQPAATAPRVAGPSLGAVQRIRAWLAPGGLTSRSAGRVSSWLTRAEARRTWW